MIAKYLFAALIIGTGATLGASQPHAADDPIKVRQATMKEVGKAMKTLGGMYKGELAYDASEAKASANTIAKNIDKVRGLFPEGSTSPDSAAKPEIWTERAKFDAAADNAIMAAKAVAATSDLDGLKASFGDLGKGCGGCHKPFRKPKN